MSRDPTSVLAAETLAHVFTMSIDTPEVSRDVRDSPLVITGVSRRWRAIALQTPKLWSYIIVGSPQVNSASLSRIRTWIRRSRNHLLRIYMDFRDPEWDWDESSHIFDCNNMDQILSLIVPHTSRWASVDILSDTWSPIHAFLHRTRTLSAPSLRRLALSRCNAYLASSGQQFLPEALEDPIPLLIGGTPGLETLSLAGVHVDWSHLHRCTLVELELKYHAQNVMPFMPGLVRMLNASALLERLVILGWGFALEDDKGGEVYGGLSHVNRLGDLEGSVHLPKLRELVFGWLDVSHACILLSLFTLPSLVALTLENVGAGIDHDVAHDDSPVLAFAEETTTTRNRQRAHGIPFERLERLALRSLRASSNKPLYSQFFAACPNVIHLELHSPEEELLEVLSTPHVVFKQWNAENLHCDSPSLQRLPCEKVINATFSDIDSCLVDQFIEFRSRYGRPISNFIITDVLFEGEGEDYFMSENRTNTVKDDCTDGAHYNDPEESGSGRGNDPGCIGAEEAVNGHRNGVFVESEPALDQGESICQQIKPSREANQARRQRCRLCRPFLYLHAGATTPLWGQHSTPRACKRPHMPSGCFLLAGGIIWDTSASNFHVIIYRLRVPAKGPNLDY